MVHEEFATAVSVMDADPKVLKDSDTIRTAAQFIMENRYRNLPVVDNAGRYLGVFGVNCLLQQVLPKATMMEGGLTNVSFIQESLKELHERFDSVAEQPISLCISSENPTAAPDTPLIETLFMLYTHRTSIPVVETETHKLVGVVSYWDVGHHVLNS